MKHEHLISYHMPRQSGACAKCADDLSKLDRWAIRVDRYPVRGEDGGQYVEDNTRLICLSCDWELEGNEPASPRPELRTAYARYKMFNQMKGDFERRRKALDGQAANTTVSPYIDAAEMLPLVELFEAEEKEAEKQMIALVRAQPEWDAFMKDAPYLKEKTAAFILSHIDIKKATTVSKVWRYLGLDPTEKYNPGKGKMRAPLYAALSIGLIRKDGKYRGDYDKLRERDKSHGGAIRRLIKLWLSHLWETWREFEKLPVRPPYEHRDGSEYKRAVNYGWPTIEPEENEVEAELDLVLESAWD